MQPAAFVDDYRVRSDERGASCSVDSNVWVVCVGVPLGADQSEGDGFVKRAVQRVRAEHGDSGHGGQRALQFMLVARAGRIRGLFVQSGCLHDERRVDRTYAVHAHRDMLAAALRPRSGSVERDPHFGVVAVVRQQCARCEHFPVRFFRSIIDDISNCFGILSGVRSSS